jgi:hypothetical protein
MMNSKWHKACSWLASLLWAAAGASLLLAWWAVYSRGLVLGLEPLAWYWNALVMGVLSLGARHEASDCGMCMMMPEKEM